MALVKFFRAKRDSGPASESGDTAIKRSPSVAAYLRANVASTFTLMLVLVVSWQPIRDVFIADQASEQLVRRLLLVSVGIPITGMLMRAARIPWWIGPPVWIVALLALLRDLVRSDSQFMLLENTPLEPGVPAPRLQWYQFALDAAREAVAKSDKLKAPTTALLGFTALVLLLVGLLTIVTHILSFEVEATFEALFPPAAILIVGSALSPGQGALANARKWALWFAITAGLHVLVDVQRKRTRRTRWLNGRVPGSERTAVLLAIFTVLLLFGGGLVSQQLGTGTLARSVDWRTGPARVRKIESPTVSLRKRLVDLKDTVLFNVDSRNAIGEAIPSYWRQTGLDQFAADTAQFSQSKRKYRPFGSGDRIPGSNDNVSPSATVVKQTFRIADLREAWVPGSFEVTNFTKKSSGITVSADPLTGSLLANADLPNGAVYEVRSIIRSADEYDPSVPTPAELLASNTALPGTLDSRVKDLAQQIVAPANGNPVEAGRLLEQFFRKNFAYSLDSRWSGRDPLANFLFDQRSGYCEQFAGAFTVLARSVGIPTRVALGFTTGDQQPDGTYQVTGKNAHAWPEMWVGGAGWISFEPTPGRGLTDELQAATTTTTRVPITSTTAVSETVPQQQPVRQQKKSGSALPWLLLAFGLSTGLAGLVLLVRSRRPAAIERRRQHREFERLKQQLDPEQVQLEWAWLMLLERLSHQLPRARLTDATRTPLEVGEAAALLLLPAAALPPLLSPATLSLPHNHDRESDSDAQSLRSIAATVTEVRFAPVGSVSMERREHAAQLASELTEKLRLREEQDAAVV